MEETKEMLLSPKEFGDLVGVSIQTLKRYEKEGDFAPHTVTENGWRKYSLNQVSEFNRMRRCKGRKAEIHRIVAYIQSVVREFDENGQIIHKTIPLPITNAFIKLSRYLLERRFGKKVVTETLINNEPLHSFKSEQFTRLCHLIQSDLIDELVLVFTNQFSKPEYEIISQLCEQHGVTITLMPEAETLPNDSDERERLIQAVRNFGQSGDIEATVIANSILTLLNETDSE